MSDDKTTSIKSVSLSDTNTQISYSTETLIPSTNDKNICWCFKQIDDDNDWICFRYFDCCSWCLEFK